MWQTDVRQTDLRRISSLNAPTLGWGHKKETKLVKSWDLFTCSVLATYMESFLHHINCCISSWMSQCLVTDYYGQKLVANNNVRWLVHITDWSYCQTGKQTHVSVCCKWLLAVQLLPAFIHACCVLQWHSAVWSCFIFPITWNMNLLYVSLSLIWVTSSIKKGRTASMLQKSPTLEVGLCLLLAFV